MELIHTTAELTEPRHGAVHRRRGGVMIVALLVIMAVGGLVTGLLHVGVAFNRESDDRLGAERCLQLAEAGLAESLVAMRAGLSGSVADEVTPARLGDGLLWVVAEDVGNDVKRVVSAAMVGGARVALEQVVFHYADPSFDAAVFASEGLVLESNSFVDSYDPSLGTYAAQLAAAGGGHVGDGAVLQSNGDIQVESAAQVYGDLHHGSGDSLVTASNAIISGISQPMAEDRVLDPVVTPAIPITGPMIVSGAVALPAGDYGFTELQVGTNGTLTIVGPARVVMTDLTIASNSNVVLDASLGPIELYVADGFSMASNSNLATPSGAASGVSVFLSGDATQQADLRSNSEFYGTIYAPEARVVVHSNFELFGALAAREVVLNSNTSVHYDEELHTPDPADERYIVGAWSTVAFPRPDLLSSRRDPFVLLGVDPSALPRPADAHLP